MPFSNNQLLQCVAASNASSPRGWILSRSHQWSMLASHLPLGEPRPHQRSGSWVGRPTFRFISSLGIVAAPASANPIFFRVLFTSYWASLVAQLVTSPPAMREMYVRSLGWEDPLEKGKDTHSSILAWRIPWTIQSMGSQRVRHN